MKKWFIAIGLAALAAFGALLFFVNPFKTRTNVGQDPTPNNRQEEATAALVSRYQSMIEVQVARRYYFDDFQGEQELRREFIRNLAERHRSGLDSNEGLPGENASVDDLVRVPFMRSFVERVDGSSSISSHQFADVFLRNSKVDGTIDWDATNEYIQVFTRTYAPLLLPRNAPPGANTVDEAMKARRRAQERLTDLRRISEASAGLAGVSIDSATHPILEWAVMRVASRAGQLREMDRTYTVGRTDFVSIGDCRIAQELEAVWPSRTVLGDGAVADEPVNVVGRTPNADLTEMRRRLQAERLVMIEGLTGPQRESIGRVYDKIEQFIANELAREDRIRRRDWSRENVSLLPRVPADIFSQCTSLFGLNDQPGSCHNDPCLPVSVTLTVNSARSRHGLS